MVKAFDSNHSDTKAQKKPAPHTPAGFLQALIKIYVSPCNLPNLFSCQISSSLKSSLVVGRWSLAKNLKPTTTSAAPPRRDWIASNPIFGAKKYLAPNIELTRFLSCREPNGRRRRTDDGFSGGADRDRTGGLLVANQALSQLSYSPKFSNQHSAFSI